MQERLGESLVEQGHITRQQLRRALAFQVHTGRHLGTSMIALGYIDPENLGEILADRHHVPHASSEILRAVNRKTLKAVSRRWVRYYGVMPLNQENGRLHAALVDPANLMVLDELRFLTNRAIVPWVAPELRIHQAIRRHYGIDWHPGSVPLADYDPKLHLPTPNGVARGDDA